MCESAVGPDNLVFKYIPVHIAEGIAAGIDAPVRVSLDMVVGAGLIAVARISARSQASALLPNTGQLSLYLRRVARDRGPQNSDQRERHGGPVKPDVVEAAKHVDQKQEHYEGDHHRAQAWQPSVPCPGGGEAGLSPLHGTRRRSELHPLIGPRFAWLRRRADLKNAIACYRVGDVLQVLLADAVEPNG